MRHLKGGSTLFWITLLLISETILIIGTAPARADEYTDWCWQNPRTTKNDLWGVSVVDKNVIWVSGYNRTILKTVDGGTNWSIQDAPTPYTLMSISAVDANTAWAVGGGSYDQSVILNTIDGGETWTEQTNPTGTLMMSVSAVDDKTVWAVGWNGKIIKTADGGLNWAEQTSPTTAPLMSVFAVDKDTAWAVGTNDGVHGTMIKTENGVDWTIQNPGTTGHLSGVTAVDANTAWAVGSDKDLSSTAIITRTTDGTNWTSQSIPEGQQLKGVSAADKTHAWAVGNYGSLFATTDGDTWVRQTPPNSASLNGVSVFDTQSAWAVGNYGTVIRTTNSGATWQLLSSEMDLVINNTDIKMVDNTTGWVVGYENGSVWGRIYKTTDAGFSWTRQDPPGTITHLYALTVVNGSTAWVTGYKGYTWKTTDGQTWVQQITPTESGMSGISAADENTVWQVGGGGLIWKTENGGAFTAQSSPTSNNLTAVHAVSPTTAYAAGRNGTILKTINGTDWIIQTSITPATSLYFYDIFAINANTAWAVGENGIIYKTTDGANWNQQTSPTGMSLYKIWAFDSNNAWAVGFEGSTIIRTTNGTDWAPVPSIVNSTQLNGVTGLTPDRVWAVGMFGAIVHTYLIDSMNPAQGPQGRLITINGSGFGATQGSSYVSFGGVQAAGFGTWSDSRITCFVPAGVPAGATDVWVQTPWGVTKKKPFTVDAPAVPHIDTLTPSSGPVGQEVTISGTGFGLRTDFSPPSVTFGSTPATTYTSWSETEIKAVVPAGASGTVQVNVHTAGGTSNYQTFTVVQQSLRVTIGPQGAIDAGGRWRRAGTTTWRASGYTETGLTPGPHTLEFRIIPGWNTKASQAVTVEPGQDFMLTADYTPNTTLYQVSGAAADPNGTVTGGGSYLHNSWVTLRALPQRGYAFSHWAEDGLVVAGAGRTYSFYAAAGRTLVAHFREIKPLSGVLMLLLGQ